MIHWWAAAFALALGLALPRRILYAPLGTLGFWFIAILMQPRYGLLGLAVLAIALAIMWLLAPFAVFIWTFLTIGVIVAIAWTSAMVMLSHWNG